MTAAGQTFIPDAAEIEEKEARVRAFMDEHGYDAIVVGSRPAGRHGVGSGGAGDLRKRHQIGAVLLHRSRRRAIDEVLIRRFAVGRW